MKRQHHNQKQIDVERTDSHRGQTGRTVDECTECGRRRQVDETGICEQCWSELEMGKR